MSNRFLPFQTRYPLLVALGTIVCVLAAYAVADMNGDNTLDIVTANLFFGGGVPTISRYVTIMFGSGDGRFYPVSLFTVGGYVQSVAVADVNGDSRLDIISGSSNVAIMLGYYGVFQIVQNFPAETFVVADMNGDNHLDIISANYGSNDVAVMLGNGNGSFQFPQLFSIENYPRSVAAADVNGDGRLDVVTANYDGGEVAVLLQK